MSGVRRVVLVTPGDILLLGNVGDLDPEALRPLGDAFRDLGIRVFVFSEDIDMSAAPGGSG